MSINSSASSVNASPLFVEVSSKTAILLVDRSGSTNTQFNSKSRDLTTIFTKMGQICNELPHEHFYVIFWSSPDYNESTFIGGVSVVPFKVAKGAALTGVFTKIATSCDGAGTCPSIGFKSIRPEWLVDNPMVYLVTDGQIGCSVIRDLDNKTALAAEITRLNAQFSIIAVESVDRNFANVENVNNAAGGDIYNIVVQYKLTGKLSKFISYSPSNKFVQIDKMKPLDGHAPYGNCCFSLKRVAEFIEYIRGEIRNDPSEDNQINIAQRLSSTLEVLTKDKPLRLANDIIRTFSSLFTLDNNIINYLMLDAVDKERNGTAQIVANYRQNLKNLFAQAANALKTDVSNAIGLEIYTKFVSPVINNNIIIGHYKNADKTVHIRNDVYKRAGWRSNVPVLPMLNVSASTTPLNQLRDQCLRQWLRCIYAELYNISAVSDYIIYLVLCDMLYVCNTVSDIDVQTAYKEFAKCMLRKGRLNTNKTELDILLEGNLPTTNSGSHEEFVTMLTSSMALRYIESGWGNCWYAICELISPELAAKQKKHCNLDSAGVRIGSTINVINESETNLYDYNCLITLEDVSTVGGYKILSHQFGISVCNPIYLLSTEGKTRLLQQNPECPVCYTHLTENDFQHIGPKVETVINVDFDIGKFKQSVSNASSSASSSSASSVSNLSGNFKNLSIKPSKKQSNAAPLVNANNKTGTIIIMKGTVGAGKTTYATYIQQSIEKRGGVCVVVGTDKYCVKGMRVPDAIQKINKELNDISLISNDDIVVVVDTCGERTNKNNINDVFGVNFTRWKLINVWPNLDRKDIPGYLCWTLNNVLARGRTTVDSAFWLNPAEAGISVCHDVHKKKAKLLGLVAKGLLLNDTDDVKRRADHYFNACVKPFEMPNGV